MASSLSDKISSGLHPIAPAADSCAPSPASNARKNLIIREIVEEQTAQLSVFMIGAIAIARRTQAERYLLSIVADHFPRALRKHPRGTPSVPAHEIPFGTLRIEHPETDAADYIDFLALDEQELYQLRDALAHIIERKSAAYPQTPT